MTGITCAFTGRLAADSELRYTANAKSVCSFSVAVDKKDADAPTEWIRVSCWDELADAMALRLVKGVSVYIEGRLRLNEWTGSDGQLKTGLNCNAWEIQPMGQIGRKAPKRQYSDEDGRLTEFAAIGAMNPRGGG